MFVYKKILLYKFINSFNVFFFQLEFQDKIIISRLKSEWKKIYICNYFGLLPKSDTCKPPGTSSKTIQKVCNEPSENKKYKTANIIYLILNTRVLNLPKNLPVVTSVSSFFYTFYFIITLWKNSIHSTHATLHKKKTTYI